MRREDESRGTRKEIRRRRCLLPIIAVIAAALSCSGCIWLAIPSLGYEGYEYEKTGSLPGMPSSGTSSSSQNNKSNSNNSPSNGSPADHSIE